MGLKTRILIADDHLIYRMGMRTMLSTNTQYEIVGEAATTREAVALYSQNQPDILLLDLRMPPDGGIDAVRAIIANDPAACILIITSYEVEEEIFQVLQAGARGYLSKDLGRDSLFQALQAISAGERWLPPAVLASLAERNSRKNLTPREIEVVQLIVRGLTNHEISSVLSISESTVKNHIYSLLNKLGVSDRTEAASFCLSHGIVRIEDL